ncbi:unnamed protein product, partial [Symbiodinium sp. CCMP2456]
KKRFNNHEIQRLYGQPGGLMLKQMHTNFVPEQRAAGLRAHQALDDVHMMRDVICCAPYLAPSLAQDISLAAHGSEFPNVTYSVWQRFLHPVPGSKPCSPAPPAWCHPIVQSVLLMQAGTMTSTSPVGTVNTAPPPPPQFAAPALQPPQQRTAQYPSEPRPEVQAQACQTVSSQSKAEDPPNPPSPSPTSDSDRLPKQHVADAEESSGGESRRSSSGSIAGVAENHPSSSQGKGPKGTGKVEDKGKGGKGKKGKPQANQQHQLRYAEGWWDPDANNWDQAWAGAWWGYPSYAEYWAWADGYGQHRPRGRGNRNNRRRPAQRPANQESASENATNEPAPDAPNRSKEIGTLNWQ